MFKTKKKVLKTFAVMIVIILSINSTPVFAADSMAIKDVNYDKLQIHFTPSNDVKMHELSADTVVAYINGVPIYVSDIKSDGSVCKQTKSAIGKAMAANVSNQTRGTFADNCMMVVATSHRNSFIMVRATMSTVGFSQQEIHNYLPNATITGFADALETQSRTTIIDFIVMHIPFIGTVYADVTTILNGMTLKSVDRLRALREDGKAAKYSSYKSSYGVTNVVAEWDKKTIKGKNYSSNDASQSRYVVNKIDYGTKY